MVGRLKAARGQTTLWLTLSAAHSLAVGPACPARLSSSVVSSSSARPFIRRHYLPREDLPSTETEEPAGQ